VSKAIALKRNPDPSGIAYIPCDISEVTHIRINLPGPTGKIVLPVITKGDRRETPCWTWNGSTESPTLKPSLLTKIDRGEDFGGTQICHSFVTDGKVQFLGDCTHKFVGQTVDLLEVV